MDTKTGPCIGRYYEVPAIKAAGLCIEVTAVCATFADEQSIFRVGPDLFDKVLEVKAMVKEDPTDWEALADQRKRAMTRSAAVFVAAIGEGLVLSRIIDFLRFAMPSLPEYTLGMIGGIIIAWLGFVTLRMIYRTALQ